MSDRYIPAEWYPQDGIMLTWPHPQSDWAPWLDKIDRLYCLLVKTISEFENVLLVCLDAQHRAHIRQLLIKESIDLACIQFHVIPSNDSWARDHGPITILKDGQPLLLDFAFNGWGGKYPADLDDRISQRLYSQSAFNKVDIEAWPLILEGGSIECDGEGTLMTTEQCLLNPTRNPGLDKNDLELALKQSLGISRVLWLDKGELIGDDTDSHIDMLARFCNPHTIAYTHCDNAHDPHYLPLKAMQQALAAFKTIEGAPYELVPLPIPDPIYNEAGDRLPASYANFLIINQAVLVPVYGDKNDALALQRLRDCFPDRKIIGINCRVLIEQFGSLHCISMQLPKGALRN